MGRGGVESRGVTCLLENRTNWEQSKEEKSVVEAEDSM